jgi:hypothetical protein
MDNKIVIYVNGACSGMFLGLISIHIDNQIPSEFSMWCAGLGLIAQCGILYFTLRRD